jgi:DNA repair exonuclease SbcCD ATPase subunit
MDDYELIDTPTLTAIIQSCFDRSTDSAVPEKAQAQFELAARRLRGHLVNLLSARFRARTAELEAANAAIADVNANLEKDLAKLEDVAKTIEKLTDLVAKLDKVLAAAAAFV